MRNKLLPRLLITILGLSLILWALVNITLGIIGESAIAVITDIRREGGEREDGRPGRYTYIISYTFELPNKSEIHGYIRRIDDGVYRKANGSGRLSVKYFKAIPYINTSEEDARFSLKQVILIAAGVLLIILMNQRKKRKPK